MAREALPCRLWLRFVGIGARRPPRPSNPCKPVKGVSRCVFGIETTPGAEPEPIQAGQQIEAEWWGRGSYFDAGRYSFLCRDVVFNGSVAGFKGGAPLLSTPTANFQGTGAGGACNTVMGAAQISADASGWQFAFSFKETGAGQYLVTDQLETATEAPAPVHGGLHRAGSSDDDLHVPGEDRQGHLDVGAERTDRRDAPPQRRSSSTPKRRTRRSARRTGHARNELARSSPRRRREACCRWCSRSTDRRTGTGVAGRPQRPPARPVPRRRRPSARGASAAPRVRCATSAGARPGRPQLSSPL